MRTLLHSYKLVNSLGLLHSLTFTTVQEYLFLLRGVSRLLAEHIGPKALYYLAAAVSDFFIPQQKLVRCTLLCSVMKSKRLTVGLSRTNTRSRVGKAA